MANQQHNSISFSICTPSSFQRVSSKTGKRKAHNLSPVKTGHYKSQKIKSLGFTKSTEVPPQNDTLDYKQQSLSTRQILEVCMSVFFFCFDMFD